MMMKLRHIPFIAAGIAGLLSTDAAAEPQHGLRFESKIVNTASAGTRENIVKPEISENAVAVSKAADNASPGIVPGPVRTIVIDPGHGGTNEGAVGVAKIHEKYLTLQVALLLADKLRRTMPDVQVVLTRQRDRAMSLGERIDVANRIHADLFLSLHFNSSNNPEAIGFESFWAGDFWAKDMEKAGIVITDEVRSQRERAAQLGERMAQCFNRAMRHRFDVLDRGVKPGDYTVLTRAEVPAVVLELAFLSHATEGIDALTPSHRSQMVDALAEAVRQYAAQ